VKERKVILHIKGGRGRGEEFFPKGEGRREAVFRSAFPNLWFEGGRGRQHGDRY